MKKTLFLLTALALATQATTAQAGAKFYKWTDAQGVTHYTAEPPPNTVKDASEVKVRNQPLPDEAADAATSAQAAGDNAQKPGEKGKGKDQAKGKGKDKEQKKEGAAGNERYAERCTQLKADLNTMKTFAKVRVSEGSGEPRLLTDEEKSAQQDEVQRQIKAFCE